MPLLLPLKGHVQHNEWGVRGPEALVARLSGLSASALASTPFAELWLGTHASGPALADGKPLGLAIGKELPFLLKVLSVAKALSIQAHPDLPLAARLHASRPDLYKDANHKPEMVHSCSASVPRGSGGGGVFHATSQHQPRDGDVTSVGRLSGSCADGL